LTLGGFLRCVRALPHWTRIALWGVLAPRLERRPLEIVQGVIEGPRGVLLAVRSELQGWELPGGGVEPGEGDAAALRREIREEIGVEVAPGERVGEYVRTGFRPHVARVYRCRIVSGTPRPSAEAPRVGWFDPAAPPPTLLVWCRQPLRDALSGGPPVSRTEHQGLPEIVATMRTDLAMRAAGGAA
jgi:8-oxo-dGTP diphosphatase